MCLVIVTLPLIKEVYDHVRGDPDALLAFLRSCSHRLGLPDTAVAATPVATEVQEVLRRLQEAQGVEVRALLYVCVDLDFLET